MHSIVTTITQLAQSAPAPSIPFWLQVTSVSLAPMLGFAGVAVGAQLKDRSDRLTALSKERHELYAEFITAMAELIDMWGNNGASAFIRSDPGKINEFMNNFQRAHRGVVALLMKIDLIGSQATVAEAQKVIELMQALIATQMKASLEGWDRASWKSGTEAVTIFARRFRNAAIKDLRIPRADRKQRDLPDYPTKWQDSLTRYAGSMTDNPEVWKWIQEQSKSTSDDTENHASSNSSETTL